MTSGKFDLTNQKHYPDLGSDALSVWNFGAVSQTSFGGETSSSVAKCRLFSQATVNEASFFFVINIVVTLNDPNNCWEKGYRPNPP